MSLSIGIRQIGDISVLDIAGRITIGEGSSALREMLRRLPNEGHRKILLNLADVTLIDSSGLGVLVAGFASISNSGGQLKLLNLTTKTRDLLLVTKLFTVFEVFEEESIATRSFADTAANVPAASH